MSDIITITEQHISPKVLPKESSFSWIKWAPDVKFDKLILKHEADITISQFLNVDDKVNGIPLEREGELIIPKELLQLDGFFGFMSFYNKPPTKERNVSYLIDVIHGEQIQTIRLEHIVTRPMVKIMKSSPESIQLSEFSSIVQPFSVELKSLGTASMHDLEYIVDFQTKDDLKVEISPFEKSINTQFLDRKASSQKISIKGKGYGLIVMKVKYKDDLGTKYTTFVRDIPIHAEGMQNQSFLMHENLENNKAHLLTVSR